MTSTGAPVVAEVVRAYADSPPEATHRDGQPDLILKWRETRTRDVSRLLSSELPAFECHVPRYLASGRSGNHLPFGWFVAIGPGIAAGRQLGHPRYRRPCADRAAGSRPRAGAAIPRAANVARLLSGAADVAPMLIDAGRDPPRTTIQCDICIVGAGPAGITLARELDDGQREICLLECGGDSFEAATQSLLAAAQGSDDYPPLQATRVGALGGSTHVWAGWCRPLDAIDFERRPEIPSSGWPIARSELDPFYVQAHAALRLGPFGYDPIAWERSSGCRALPLAGDDVRPILFRKSDVNFGREHVAALRRSQQIRAWLHSTALRVRYSPDGHRVLSIEVGVTGLRRTFDVAPRIAVLATGGIENARLLLLSDSSGAAAVQSTYTESSGATSPSIATSTAADSSQTRDRCPHSALRA